MTGALAAGRRKMDVLALSSLHQPLPTIGGGSVRDILLGHHPLGWVKHPEYIITVITCRGNHYWVAP